MLFFHFLGQNFRIEEYLNTLSFIIQVIIKIKFQNGVGFIALRIHIILYNISQLPNSKFYKSYANLLTKQIKVSVFFIRCIEHSFSQSHF